VEKIVPEEKKEALKQILRQLHSGVSVQEVKEKFKRFLEGISSEDIARIEQELIGEGLSREEIRKLCDIHLEVFKEQLERQRLIAPSETPIGILIEEHKIIEDILNKLTNVVERIQQAANINIANDEIAKFEHLTKELLDAEKHYLREENALFPALEKHGISEPPAIMWMEHNQLRKRKKQLHDLVKSKDKIDFNEFKKELNEIVKDLKKTLSSHIFKENKILFPTALRVIEDEEWNQIKQGFDEIGYCCFTPPQTLAVTPQAPKTEEKTQVATQLEETLNYETGTLTTKELEAILNTLPVDITFVDKNDRVKYFNKGKERIFVRTKAIIGRKVQLCHPQKSIHIVNKILDAFRNGERDSAEFWIQKDGRTIYIRYFAVRDKNNEYLGTLEVTQDITRIKDIGGEKRLLDWGN